MNRDKETRCLQEFLNKWPALDRYWLTQSVRTLKDNQILTDSLTPAKQNLLQLLEYCGMVQVARTEFNETTLRHELCWVRVNGISADWVSRVHRIDEGYELPDDLKYQSVHGRGMVVG